MHNEPDRSATGHAADPLDELLSAAQWPDDDRLDQLLRMARWPEAAASSQTAPTLPRPLLRGRTAIRPRGRAIAVGLTAAALGFAAVALWGTHGLRVDPASDLAPSSGTAASRAPVPDAVPVLSLALPAGELSRRMLLARNPSRSPATDEALVERILVERVLAPDGDLDALIRPLLAGRARSEQVLLRRLPTLAGRHATAAVELLGRVGGEASVAQLMGLRLKPSLHAPAVRALLRIGDTGTLARLVRSEDDVALREEIAAVLRGQGDRKAQFFMLATEGGL